MLLPGIHEDAGLQASWLVKYINTKVWLWPVGLRGFNANLLNVGASNELLQLVFGIMLLLDAHGADTCAGHSGKSAFGSLAAEDHAAADGSDDEGGTEANAVEVEVDPGLAQLFGLGSSADVWGELSFHIGALWVAVFCAMNLLYFLWPEACVEDRQNRQIFFERSLRPRPGDIFS